MTDKSRPRTDETDEPGRHEPTADELDERFTLHPLSPEEALRKLLGNSPKGRAADK